jgi:hypothetical protein
MIELRVEGAPLVAFEARQVLVAGYTGRDGEQVKRHIEELRLEGVPPPETVPVFYPLTPDRVWTASTIHVLGPETSGEAEAVLLLDGEAAYVAVGSDHTDRALERQDMRLSKQICPKPISSEVWRLEDVADHWDRIELRSWVTSDGRRSPYQQGTLQELLPPHEIIELARARTSPDLGGAVILCGTLPVLAGGLVPGDSFEAELYDPVRSRRLACSYSVNVVRSEVD